MTNAEQMAESFRASAADDALLTSHGVAPREAISPLNNSAHSNSSYSSEGISVSTEKSRENFSSITFEIPRTIEGTLFPALPPEAISAVKSKVEQQFYCLIRKKGDQISANRFDDTIFYVSTTDKSSSIMHPPEGITIVTLSGTSEMVEFGQECVKNFILQAKVWQSLLRVTELDSLSRYDISVQVSLATCPLQSQIRIADLDEYYVNLRRTNGVWVSNLVIGTELHFILGDLIREKGACLLKVDGVWMQSSNDVKVACDEAKIAGNDTVEATFRFPIEVDLSMIRGEYVIEKSFYEEKSNDGGSPPPPVEIDDQSSAYASFIAKFKAVPTIEFHGLCVASVRTSMWNQHKLIYGPSCDSECPCASNLKSICDTVRSDFHINNAPGKTKELEGKVGFLDYFYKFYYPEVESKFPSLRPQEVFDKVVALWRVHLESPLHGPFCHENCSCLDASLLSMQQKRQHLLVRLPQEKARPALRNPKYSIARDPNPTVPDVAARCSGKSLSDVILRKLENKPPKGETKKLVYFQKIDGDDQASIPRGCVTQLDSILITDGSQHFDEDLNTDKYSIANLFSRRQNSESWKETKEQKYAMRDTHVWNPIEDSGFACSKCRISKGKFFSCKLCGTCLSCGSKSPCEDSEPSHPSRGRLSSFKLAHLLRRRYEVALLATFGLGLVKTVALRDLSDRTVEKDADIYKVKSNEMSYCQDFSRAIELIELEPSFINLPLSSSTAEGDHVELPRELVGRSILFAAVMYSTHSSVLYLLKRGSDARLRDLSNKRASDVVKERREKLINRMKQIWNGEVTPNLDEEEMLKAEIKDVETTSKVIQVYMAGERLINLSSGVKSWSLVQVKILQATNLQFSPQIAAFSAPDLLFCVPTWDGRQLNHITTVEPLSQNPDWSKSIPYQFRFNDEVKSSYTGKTLLVQLIKGDPTSRDNFLLSTWQSTGEELNQIANYKAIKGTFPLSASQFLESGYISIEIQRLPYDSEYEKKVKKTQSNELSGLIGLVEGLKALKVDLPSNLTIPTADDLSLLHAAIYLENFDLVRTLLNLGASVTTGAPGRSPMELSKSMNDKCPNKDNEKVLSVLCSHVSSITPSTESIDKTPDHPAPDSYIRNESTPIDNSILPGLSANLGSTEMSARNNQLSFDAPVKHSHLPLIRTSDWMLPRVSKQARCQRFIQAEGCDAGRLCHDAHVYCSTQPFANQVPKNDELYNAYLNRFDIKLKMSDFYVLEETGLDGNSYFTGALVCPISKVIYYAKGGPDGQKDEQDIYWYRSKRCAKMAVSSIVLSALTAGDRDKHSDSGRPVLETSLAKTNSSSIPKLKNTHWMLEKVKKREICRYFNSTNGCDKKAMCYFAHVYISQGSKNISFSSALEKLLMAYDEVFKTKLTLSSFYETTESDNEGKIWFAGGFCCPVESTIYYSLGGSNGQVNQQGLFLYPSIEDARAAVAGVVLDALRGRGMVTSGTSSGETRSATSQVVSDNRRGCITTLSDPLSEFPVADKELCGGADSLRTGIKDKENPCLPFLHKTEWMLKEPKVKTCIVFSRNNACAYGKSCSFAHIHNGEQLIPEAAVTEEDFFLSYRQKFGNNIVLDITNFIVKTERAPDGVEWFTAAFLCPVKEIIYVAAGCEQSFRSSQNLFWYRSPEAAIGAVSAVVVVALKRLDDVVPMLPNALWMVEAVGARYNCRDFNLNNICPNGAQCEFAHIYTPKVKVPSTVPDSAYALWNCYKDNFNVSLKNSSFYEKSAVDQEGKTWYTGFLLCPVENTIYCAEGGKGWRISEQNIFWYKSVKEARAAVSAVVLIALSARGIRSEWGDGSNSLKEAAVLCNKASFDESSTDGRYKRSLEIADDEQHAKKTHLDEKSGHNIICQSNHLGPLPVLPKVDWMLKYPKAKQCFAFERDHVCLLGKNCGYGHVYRLKENLPPTENFRYSQLGNLYKAIFDADLTDSDILKKEEIAPNGRTWFTGCIVCPDQTIYNAAGGKNGHRNSQGLYFYPSHEDMLDALAGIFLHVMGERAEILPSLQEPEWMLEVVKAAQTCKYFPGCARMEKCHFAHIYRGGDPDPTQTVENDSLLKVYKLKFNRTIKNSDFYEKVALDKAGRRIYTGALRCPAERTIYYARGMGGLVSAQNIYWYTSKKAAKIAVTAVVITALATDKFLCSSSARANCSFVLHTEAPVAKSEDLSKCEPLKLPQNKEGGMLERDVLLASRNSQDKITIKGDANNPREENATRNADTLLSKCFAKPSHLTAQNAKDGYSLTNASPSVSDPCDGNQLVDRRGASSCPTILPEATPMSLELSSTYRDSFRSNWMEGGAERCLKYKAFQQCPLGSTCSYSHKYSPSSDLIKNPPSFVGLSKIYCFIFGLRLQTWHVSIKLSADAEGKTWFTAGLRCPAENVHYYAEKGTTSIKTPQGVYWYPDLDSAQIALRAVLFTSLVERGFLKKKSDTISVSSTKISSIVVEDVFSARSSHCAPSLLNAQQNLDVTVQPVGTVALASKQPFSNDSASPKGIISGINYQSVYMKIFSLRNFPNKVVSLPNSCFTYDERDIEGKKCFCAEFSSPGESGALYASCEMDGGIFEGGRWWFVDQKAAKSAAFHSFLQSMINRGILLDFQRDSKGRLLY